ncbi:MAG: metallophosphoesterase family protein, partial [Candidatus Firestonebacteria bacterium]
INPHKVAIENQSDIYLYGHSHLYEAVIKGDALFLNPGSLKYGDNRSRILTFGLLELEEKKAVGKVLDLQGKVLVESVLLKL